MRTPLHGLKAPYELPSDVIHFTDWRYVAPGAAGWAGADGKRAGVWRQDTPPGGFRWQPADVPTGVRIRAQRARKEPVDIPRDKPWERLTTWSTLLRDGGVYRLWYHACALSGYDAPVPNLTDLLCYAESDDGFHWRKPALGISEFEGDDRTNIVYGGALAGEPGYHGGAVFIDAGAAAEQRYKMVYMGSVPKDQYEAYQRDRPDDLDPGAVREDLGPQVFGVYGATSPDGLRWRPMPRPLVVQHADTLNVGYYDEFLKKYVAYFRTWYLGRRCIGRSETDDFGRFPIPENVLVPGAGEHPSDQWYTNARTTCPDAPDYHLMFPAMYSPSDDGTRIYTYASADGIVWTRVPGGPVISPGKWGDPDGGCIFAGCGLVQLPDERWALPCTTYVVPHKYPRNQPLGDIVHAVWDKGRLAAVEAAERGEFALMPIRATGTRIVLNVRTKHAGHVRVEAADEKGTALPGRGFEDADPIAGNFPAKEVTWRGQSTTGTEPGTPIVLRFRLHAAELFGVSFLGS